MNNFKDSILATRLTDVGLMYYEKLGVSIAVLGGGGAIIKYSEKIFPIAPQIAIAIGVINITMSMMLMTAISFQAWADLKIPENRKFLSATLLSSIILSSTFFFIASGAAIFKQFAS